MSAVNLPALADAKDAIAILNAMSRSERALLLYLETCAVDKGGIVAACHMNAEDFATARRWSGQRFLRFSRIPSTLQLQPRGLESANHVVEFTDASFLCAHVERRRRAERSQSRELVQASLGHFDALREPLEPMQ